LKKLFGLIGFAENKIIGNFDFDAGEFSCYQNLVGSEIFRVRIKGLKKIYNASDDTSCKVDFLTIQCRYRRFKTPMSIGEKPRESHLLLTPLYPVTGKGSVRNEKAGKDRPPSTSMCHEVCHGRYTTRCCFSSETRYVSIKPKQYNFQLNLEQII